MRTKEIGYPIQHDLHWEGRIPGVSSYGMSAVVKCIPFETQVHEERVEFPLLGSHGFFNLVIELQIGFAQARSFVFLEAKMKIV